MKLYKVGLNISIYNFLATDFKLPISNNEENIQSVIDLIKLGYIKKDIHIIFGNILKGLDIDDDEKFFFLIVNKRRPSWKFMKIIIIISLDTIHKKNISIG